MQQHPTLYVQDDLVRSSNLTSARITVPAAWEIRGNVSGLDVLAALQALIQRHDALRTSIVRDARRGELAQRVAERGGIDDVVTIVHAPGVDPDRVVARLTRTLVERAFDLTRAPLWRAYVAALGRGHSVVCLGFAGVIVDEQAVEVVGRDLAGALGETLAARPAQPGALARSERRMELSPLDRRWWREQYDRRTPLAAEWQGPSRHDVAAIPPIPADAVARLALTGIDSATLMAAIAAVAARAVLGCANPMLGLPSPSTATTRSVVGPLRDQVPMLGGGAPKQTPFAEFASGLKRRRADALEHALPSGMLAGVAGGTPYDIALRTEYGRPLRRFEVGDRATVVQHPLPLVGRSAVQRATGAVPVLAVHVRREADRSVSGSVTGIRALHELAEVHALADAFSAIARSAAADPSTPIGRLARRD